MWSLRLGLESVLKACPITMALSPITLFLHSYVFTPYYSTPMSLLCPLCSPTPVIYPTTPTSHQYSQTLSANVREVAWGLPGTPSRTCDIPGSYSVQSSICQNQCPRLYIRALRDFSPPSLPLFGAAQRPHLHSSPAPDGHEQLSLALDQTTLDLSLLLLPEKIFSSIIISVSLGWPH